MLDLQQMDDTGKLTTIWPRVIVRSWMDRKFRDDLMADPHEVLATFELKLPKSLNVLIIPGHEQADVKVDGSAPTLVLRLPEIPEGLSAEHVTQIEQRLLKCSLGTCLCW